MIPARSAAERQPLEEVLALFVKLGGRDPLLASQARGGGENSAARADRGVAVIVNRPLGGGDLLAQMRQKPLPDWAAEFACNSWAQFLLKWIIAHPAVTCAIPATGKAGHLEDNMHGGVGKLPDAKQRQRIVEAVAEL